MQTVTTSAALRETVADWRTPPQRIALVPTMGNLHDGHLSLIRCARQAGDRVVASIFVNPLQFSAAEDFEGYRRTLDMDAGKLREAGVDLLFAPVDAEIYPHGHRNVTAVEVPVLSTMLCGEFRPGHFRGVATVVAKLFNLVQPDVAVFGEKDYQQLLVIRRMVTDLDFPVRIIAAPTVRETDGLAMSSRNGYLAAGERQRAAVLYETLSAIRDAIMGGLRDYGALEAEGRLRLERAGFRPDYVAVRRSADLLPAGASDRNLAILGAAWLGRARLIDNLQLGLSNG